MAQFIQSSPEELNEGEEFSSIEDDQIPKEMEQPEELEQVEESAELEAEEEVIPEKYQGKSIQDIVQMHQEAEKLLGRQSSEVGELRKIVDDFVKTRLEEAKSPQKEEAEEIDFFTDPEKAVERLVSKHPKIKEAENITLVMKQQEALGRLKANHPDYETIVRDAEFAEWVTKSKIRTELFQRADQQFDYDSADELLTSWKERQNIVKETADMQDADRKRQLKAASTGSTKGSGEKTSRKIYRRADIIKLMQTDPNRYQELAPEIRQAYAEGRVK